MAEKAWRRIEYKAIPIFINARDLLTPLRRLVHWLFDAGYEQVYVLDNDSSYPPLLDFYESMRKELRVLRLGANVGHTAFWDAKILERLSITGPFVLTDPDIVPIEECPRNVLEFFWDALQAYPNKSKAGFGLKIDDLPKHYKLRGDVIAWESQFWKKKITPKLFDADLDTTFALYRPNASYDLSAMRSGFPYLACHWPWHQNSAQPSDDQLYYLQHAKPGVSNWSGTELPEWIGGLLANLKERDG